MCKCQGKTDVICFVLFYVFMDVLEAVQHIVID